MDVGDRIDARYRLERLLGEGGMAAVYLAHDERLERPVALKLLWGAPRVSAAMAEAFLREARIAASIRHANVVQVLDFGKHEGAPYMVMEALEGEAMADRYSRGYRFQMAEVVAIGLGCLEGLAAVHGSGIVHRDLKPENIFLTKPAGPGLSEVPKLLDFGISRAADKSSGLRSAVTTREGRLVGTPEYMSPEQARGLSNIDLRTDLYSLGVVLYEALWGRPPFESENDGDLMIMVMAGNALPLEARVPEVGRALSQVVAQAMARDREQRFASAAAMHAALRGAWEATYADGPIPSLPGGSARAASERPIEATLSELSPTVAPRAHATVVSGRGRSVVLSAVLVAAVAVGAALAFVLLRPQGATEGSPRYIVVQGASGAGAEPQARSPGALSPGALPPGDALPGDATTEPSVDSVDMDFTIGDVEASVAPRPGAPRPRPTADRSPTQLLAQAFERQKAGVVACLRANLDALPEQAELSVRIELAASGAVVSATISPDSVAQSPVGQCIARATEKMQFGQQPGSLAFRVPLTARRK